MYLRTRFKTEGHSGREDKRVRRFVGVGKVVGVDWRRVVRLDQVWGKERRWGGRGIWELFWERMKEVIEGEGGVEGVRT